MTAIAGMDRSYEAACAPYVTTRALPEARH